MPVTKEYTLHDLVRSEVWSRESYAVGKEIKTELWLPLEGIHWKGASGNVLGSWKRIS